MKKLFILCAMAFFSFNSFSDVIIIANKDVKETSLTKAALKKMFTARMKKWEESKTPIKLAVLKKGEAHEEFVKKLLGMTPSKFKTHWKKLIFTGKGKPPKSFKSAKELVEYVKKTSGAIACISPETEHSDVKTIEVK